MVGTGGCEHRDAYAFGGKVALLTLVQLSLGAFVGWASFTVYRIEPAWGVVVGAVGAIALISTSVAAFLAVGG